MAVEILEKDLGIPVREMTGSDIAYDVHVRRVFLRTGLAEVDDQDHMVSMARRVHPQRPGALDVRAWVIGRTWCRPRDPDCPACVLDEVCAHRIARETRYAAHSQPGDGFSAAVRHPSGGRVAPVASACAPN